MKFEKMEVGMTLHMYGRSLGMLGSSPASWPVRIEEIDSMKRRVFASWNYNPPRWYSECEATKWRKKSLYETQREKGAK